MTTQAPDKLTNECPGVTFGNLKVVSIAVGDPSENNGWGKPYQFLSSATDRKKYVTSALWRGYISNYRLDGTGRLILDNFEYPAPGRSSSEKVEEALEGDFWLVMRSSSGEPRLYVPFSNGFIVKDRAQWVKESDHRQNQNSPTSRLDRSKGYKVFIVASLLAIAAALVYVPFESTYADKMERSRAYEGYAFIWAPPDPVGICTKTFGLTAEPYQSTNDIIQSSTRKCVAKPIISQILIVVIALALVLAAIGFLIYRQRP